jgi:hypothetical protein
MSHTIDSNHTNGGNDSIGEYRDDNLCYVCLNRMKVYYKSFSYMLNFCDECYHFDGEIFNDGIKHNIFKNITSDKIYTTIRTFYSTFYHDNSYTLFSINNLLNVVVNLQSHEHIYLLCESYDNAHTAKEGKYEFYSTNSIKYIASKYNLDLINVYVITDKNRTIYEFVSMFDSDLTESEKKQKLQGINKISNILYNEISNGVYI